MHSGSSDDKVPNDTLAMVFQRYLNAINIPFRHFLTAFFSQIHPRKPQTTPNLLHVIHIYPIVLIRMLTERMPCASDFAGTGLSAVKLSQLSMHLLSTTQEDLSGMSLNE